MILAYLGGIWLPWWSIALAGFAVMFLLPEKPMSSFLSGFLAIFILWGLLSLKISIANEHLLAGRISAVFYGFKSPTLLFVTTGIIGGLVTGLSGLTGSLLRRSFTT